LVLYIASSSEVGVWSKPQRGPNVVRKIAKKMEWIRSIVANGGGIIVGSAVLFMVETDMNGPSQFGQVPIQISEKEFDVAAEEPVVSIREVPLGAMRFQVFSAEHPDRPLKLWTAQREIERDHQQKPRFP
jgi:hypothetical protein